VCAALDVGFEVPGVQAEVQVPDAGRVAVLLELAIDASQVQQRVSVARAQPSHLFVLRSRLADGALGFGAHRLDLVELGEDQVRIGIFGAQPDGFPSLASGLVEAPHLAVEPGRFHTDGGSSRIQLLGAAKLHERRVAVTDEASLQPEAVVQIGLGTARRPGDQGHRRCLSGMRHDSEQNS